MCKQENFLRHKETPVTKSRLFSVLHLICWDIIWFHCLSWKCHFTTVKILYLNKHFFVEKFEALRSKASQATRGLQISGKASSPRLFTDLSVRRRNTRPAALRARAARKLAVLTLHSPVQLCLLWHKETQLVKLFLNFKHTSFKSSRAFICASNLSIFWYWREMLKRASSCWKSCSRASLNFATAVWCLPLERYKDNNELLNDNIRVRGIKISYWLDALTS